MGRAKSPQPSQRAGSPRQSGSYQGIRFNQTPRSQGWGTGIGDAVPIRLNGGTRPVPAQGGFGSLNTKNVAVPAAVAGVAVVSGTNVAYVGQSGPIVKLPLNLPQFVNPQTGERIGGGVITTAAQFKQTFGVYPTTSTAPRITGYTAYDGSGASQSFSTLSAAQTWIGEHKFPSRVWAIYANYSDGTFKNVQQGVG